MDNQTLHLAKRHKDYWISRAQELQSNPHQLADEILEFTEREVKNLNTSDVNHSGYVCHIGKERVFIIAEDIAQSMDKMKEIAGDSIFGYSMESHSSIRVIHCG